MADAINGLFGGAMMAAFLLLIAIKLNQVALWTVILFGIGLMSWAIWSDNIAPLFKRNGTPR